MKDIKERLGEAAKYFNDALLDEQKKQIDELKKQNAKLSYKYDRVNKDLLVKDAEIESLENTIHCQRDEIASMDANFDCKVKQLENVIASRNNDIERLSIEVEKTNRLNHLCDEQAKLLRERGKEISRLCEVIHKKNLKIDGFRSWFKDRTKRCCDLVTENVDLKEELEKLKKAYADKVVDAIDAQALKSAENALQEKDEVIADLAEEISDLYEMIHGDPILNMKERKKKPRIPTLEEPKSNASMKQILEDARESSKKIDKYLTDFLVTAGYGGGNGILDQMKENHPTEDEPEEISIKDAMKVIKKAMKKGHAVIIDYDDAADIINSTL